MAQRRNSTSVVSFGLSFLDVLCCGLGGAVLLLLILKRGPVDTDIPDEGYLEIQIDVLIQLVATKNDRKTELEVAVGDTRDKIDQDDLGKDSNIQS